MSNEAPPYEKQAPAHGTAFTTWLIDGGLALAAGVPLVVYLATHQMESEWLAWIVALGQILMLVLRRVWPEAVLLAVVATECLLSLVWPAIPSGMPTGWLAVYTLSTQRTLALSLPGLAVAVLVPAFLGAFLGGGSDLGFGGSSGINLFLVVAFSIGLAVRAVRERIATQEALAREQVARASQEERSRIAAEMHDIVAHSISVMLALSGGAKSALAHSPREAATALDQLNKVGARSLEEMKRVLYLDQSDAQLSGAEEAIDFGELVGSFHAAGLPVDIEFDENASLQDSALRMTIYRIVQEGLTNVLRHGDHVSVVKVRVSTRGSVVTVLVTDDGRQIARSAKTQSSGRGLEGIRQRARLYDGKVSAGFDTDGGWTLRVDLDTSVRAERA